MDRPTFGLNAGGRHLLITLQKEDELMAISIESCTFAQTDFKNCNERAQ